MRDSMKYWKKWNVVYFKGTILESLLLKILLKNYFQHVRFIIEVTPPCDKVTENDE